MCSSDLLEPGLRANPKPRVNILVSMKEDTQALSEATTRLTRTADAGKVPRATQRSQAVYDSLMADTARSQVNVLRLLKFAKFASAAANHEYSGASQHDVWLLFQWD